MSFGIRGFLSPAIRYIFANQNIDESNLLEVRLRINQPVMMLYTHGEYILSNSSDSEYIVRAEDIRATLDLVSNYSLYAYEQEIKQGYITVKGGHRVGFTGQVVMEDGRIKTVKHISFLNIRVANWSLFSEVRTLV